MQRIDIDADNQIQGVRLVFQREFSIISKHLVEAVKNVSDSLPSMLVQPQKVSSTSQQQKIKAADLLEMLCMDRTKGSPKLEKLGGLSTRTLDLSTLETIYTNQLSAGYAKVQTLTFKFSKVNMNGDWRMPADEALAKVNTITSVFHDAMKTLLECPKVEFYGPLGKAKELKLQGYLYTCPDITQLIFDASGELLGAVQIHEGNKDNTWRDRRNLRKFMIAYKVAPCGWTTGQSSPPLTPVFDGIHILQAVEKAVEREIKDTEVRAVAIANTRALLAKYRHMAQHRTIETPSFAGGQDQSDSPSSR